jgi:HSP20 family protein
MSLVPWRDKGRERDRTEPVPYSPIEGLRAEMDRLFDHWSRTGPEDRDNLLEPFGPWAPELDISETADEIRIEAEVPGIDPKDLDVAITGDTLTVSGEKQESTEHKGDSFVRSERRFGSFRRSIRLPAPVDADKVAAEYKDGVLTIQLRKLQSAAPKRIPVSAGRK